MSRLIERWEDLVGLENDEYYLDIEINGGCGWIRKKVEDPDDFDHYLSTHTFYDHDYKYNTIKLQECGFDVQLKNWDGPTEEVSYRDQWLYDGKCKFCRRSKYCTKNCKAYEARLQREIRYAMWKRGICCVGS